MLKPTTQSNPLSGIGSDRCGRFIEPALFATAHEFHYSGIEGRNDPSVSRDGVFGWWSRLKNRSKNQRLGFAQKMIGEKFASDRTIRLQIELAGNSFSKKAFLRRIVLGTKCLMDFHICRFIFLTPSSSAWSSATKSDTSHSRSVTPASITL